MCIFSTELACRLCIDVDEENIAGIVLPPGSHFWGPGVPDALIHGVGGVSIPQCDELGAVLSQHGLETVDIDRGQRFAVGVQSAHGAVPGDDAHLARSRLGEVLCCLGDEVALRTFREPGGSDDLDAGTDLERFTVTQYMNVCQADGR